jgi:hypothetical protein
VEKKKGKNTSAMQGQVQWGIINLGGCKVKIQDVELKKFI